MLKFELPEIIYKVTKYLDVKPLPYDKIKEFESMKTSYHFKDINLAEEFYRSFDDDYEYVETEIEGDIIQYKLKVLTHMDVINTLDIIPHIIDL